MVTDSFSPYVLLAAIVLAIILSFSAGTIFGAAHVESEQPHHAASICAL
jgi:hypothetical protein